MKVPLGWSLAKFSSSIMESLAFPMSLQSIDLCKNLASSGQSPQGGVVCSRKEGSAEMVNLVFMQHGVISPTGAEDGDPLPTNKQGSPAGESMI